jgi:hypothetical protein
VMFRVNFTDSLFQAQKVQWLQQVGAKRVPSNWRIMFRKRRLNDRCIVAMVGDGINDAPVSNSFAYLRYYLHHLLLGIDCCRYWYRHWIGK